MILDVLIYTKSGIAVFILVVAVRMTHIIKKNFENLIVETALIYVCLWWAPFWEPLGDGCELKVLLAFKAVLNPYKFQNT